MNTLLPEVANGNRVGYSTTTQETTKPPTPQPIIADQELGLEHSASSETVTRNRVTTRMTQPMREISAAVIVFVILVAFGILYNPATHKAALMLPQTYVRKEVSAETLRLQAKIASQAAEITKLKSALTDSQATNFYINKLIEIEENRDKEKKQDGEGLFSKDNTKDWWFPILSLIVSLTALPFVLRFTSARSNIWNHNASRMRDVAEKHADNLLGESEIMAATTSDQRATLRLRTLANPRVMNEIYRMKGLIPVIQDREAVVNSVYKALCEEIQKMNQEKQDSQTS